jgi:hypothetical protein
MGVSMKARWDIPHHHFAIFLYLLIASITAALYVPFLHNAIVFDDHNLFTNLSVYDHAANPFNLAPRNFPYFTLGFTEVIWKDITAHRVVSLLIHLLNTLVLFRLIGKLLEQIGDIHSRKSLLLAFIGALFFAIHPVSVYGAGYLVQRTILFATLFSLLSLWFYWRSLSRNHVTDAITAALFYALAVYSKEHAIMLPAAAVLLTLLHKNVWREHRMKAAAYLTLCLPPSIFVVLAVKGVIGSSYEPDSAKFVSAIHVADSVSTQWLVSAVTQAGLFFEYLRIWLLPDVNWMSADIRVNFSVDWTTEWIFIKSVSFIAFAIVGAFFLQRRGRLGLIGWGMLCVWLLFATELASIRFQEPFVLYRSYLWAPAIVLVLTSILSRLGMGTLVSTALVLTPILFVLSQDRLSSLESDLSLWIDAEKKLFDKLAPGSDRIYYNRGTQFLKAKRYSEAIADFSESLKRSPQIFQSYQQRGIAHFSTHNFPNALADFDSAIALNQTQGLSYYGKAMTLEKMGNQEEAITNYKISSGLGYLVANMALRKMESNTTQNVTK